MREIFVIGAVLLSGVLSGCATVDVELVTLGGAKITAGPPEALTADAEDEATDDPGDPADAAAPVRVTKEAITLDEKIQFETWSATLAPSSFAILDEVAKVLAAHAEIKKVRICGHTAHTGSAKKSMQLSVDRANAVREYLVKKGVAGDRLVTKGYGETKPIADNSSADGRERNRRVELLVASREGGR